MAGSFMLILAFLSLIAGLPTFMAFTLACIGGALFFLGKQLEKKNMEAVAVAMAVDIKKAGKVVIRPLPIERIA